METHPNEYERPIQVIQQQNQYYQSRPITTQNEQQFVRPQNQGLPKYYAGQKLKAPVKMSKARALALANTLKRLLAVASIVGFGTFGGLVALHQVGSTASQSTQSSSGSSNTSSTSSSSSQNSNSFFSQQGGNTSGTSSSSSAVTGTHTS